MAVAIVSTGSWPDTSNTTTAKATGSFSVGAGHAALLGISIPSTATVNSISDSAGRTWTKINNITRADNSSVSVEVWRYVNTSGAAISGTATFNLSAGSKSVILLGTFSGIDTGNPIGTNGTGVGSSSTPSISVNMNAAGSMMVGFYGTNGEPTFTADASDTLIVTLNSGGSGGGSTKTRGAMVHDDNLTSTAGTTLTTQGVFGFSAHHAMIGIELRAGATETVTAVAVADANAGRTEATDLTVTASVSDANAGRTEAVDVYATVSSTDTAAGADTANLSVPLSLTESPIGTDSVSIQAFVDIADANTTTQEDAVIVAFLSGVTDAGSGTDALVVDQGTQAIAVSDAASGTDAALLQVRLALAETNATIEAASVSTTAAVSDTATGTDATTLLVQPALSDTATAAETLAASAAASVTESGAGSDVTDSSLLLALTDTGPTPNLLINPSFETNLTETALSNLLSSGTPTLSRDTATGAFGTASAKVDIPATAQTEEWRVKLRMQDTTLLSFTAGETYTASAYVKSSDSRPVKLAVEGGINHYQTGGFTTSTDWQRTSFTFTASATGTARFNILMNTGAAGSIWVDAAMVEQSSFLHAYTDADNPVATGRGGDTASAVASLTLTETATGAESSESTASLDVPETGTGADTATVSTSGEAITLADSATGTDALLFSTTLDLSDAATTADALTLSAVLALVESSTAAEALDLAATLGLTETTGGTEALDFLRSVFPSDAGTGVESLSALIDLSATDTATAADAATASVTFELAESAVGADLLDLLALLTTTDTATAAEAISALADLALSDAVTSADTASLFTPLSLEESATGADQVVSAIGAFLSETGTATEALSVLATVALSDSSAASDAVSLLAALALSDAAVSTDALVALAMIGLSDTVTGAELLEVLADQFVSLADSGSATDLLTTFANLAVADAASATDAAQPLTFIEAGEASTGTDELSKLVNAFLTDPGNATEAVQLLLNLVLADTGSAVDELLRRLIGGGLYERGQPLIAATHPTFSRRAPLVSDRGSLYSRGTKLTND